MRTNGWPLRRPDGTPPAPGVLALRLLLAAALVPVALRIGAVAPPFDLPRPLLGASLALVVGGTAHGVALRARSRRAAALRAALLLAGVAVAALLFDRIVAARATAFFTGATLAEVMAVLLAAHLLGALAQRAATRAAAMPVADHAETAAAAALALFWSIAAAGMRELAGVPLLAAAACVAAALPLRLGQAWLAASLGDRVRARRHGRGRRPRHAAG